MENQRSEILTPIQVRVLACLMEKHLATPKNYPLTPTSLTAACNQKSNRFPAMALDEGKVLGAAQQLKEQGYVSIDYDERVVKYSHRAPGMLKVTREEQAVLSMLMLREPLTLNDLKARTEKMIGFDSIKAVHDSVKQLVSRNPSLIIELPVAVGQREQRYTHLLAGEPDLSEINVKPVKPMASSSQAKKIIELESRIERLEAALDMQWAVDE